MPGDSHESREERIQLVFLVLAIALVAYVGQSLNFKETTLLWMIFAAVLGTGLKLVSQLSRVEALLWRSVGQSGSENRREDDDAE